MNIRIKVSWEDFTMELFEMQDYAKEEMQKVEARLPKKEQGDVRFVFLTDLHYKFIREMRTTVSNIIHVLNEMNKKEKIDFICLGGDNVGNYPNSREEHVAMMEELAELLKNSDIPVLVAQGNHDDNSIHGRIEGTEQCRTGFEVLDAVQYDVLFSHCKEYADYHEGGDKALYGYYDIKDADTRVVVLNSSDVPYILNGDILKYIQQWDFGYTGKQLEWLCKTALKDAPSNVIFMQHIPFDMVRFAGGEMDNTKNYKAVAEIIKAFAEGGKIEISSDAEDFAYHISHDFEGKKHNVVAKIAGHCHVDTVTTDTDGFACVTTMLSGRKASGVGAGDDGIVYEREPYSAVETAMDIFTFSSKNNTLSAVRYGSGVDRVIR